MKNARGFTLIELMIVVAVVAILARLAIASYSDSINKSRRSEATTTLLEGAQQLERYYSAHGTYIDNSTTTLAAVYRIQVPANGTPYYTIGVASGTTPSATTFTLQATRINTGAMSNDKCGDFKIDQAGAQTLANATWTVDKCWRR